MVLEKVSSLFCMQIDYDVLTRLIPHGNNNPNPKNTIIPRSIITLSRQMTFFGDRRFFYGISSTHPCTKELNERNVSATSNEIV